MSTTVLIAHLIGFAVVIALVAVFVWLIMAVLKLRKNTNPQTATVQSASAQASLTDIRIGTAVDFHAFDPEGKTGLKLCTLTWPDEVILSGHSDGDVAAHAICDALLSAAGKGDMGSNFGTDRPEYAGASGTQFLRDTLLKVREAGLRPVNVTVQVVGNKPRLGKRYDEAQAALGEIVGCPVSVSATTSDKMGFAGRGEGLAAIATALLARR